MAIVRVVVLISIINYWASVNVKNKNEFFRITDEENRNLYTYMERLDQGHLQPSLEEGPRLTCPGRESNLGLRGGRRALILKIQCFFTCHLVAKLPAPLCGVKT